MQNNACLILHGSDPVVEVHTKIHVSMSLNFEKAHLKGQQAFFSPHFYCIMPFNIGYNLMSRTCLDSKCK